MEFILLHIFSRIVVVVIVVVIYGIYLHSRIILIVTVSTGRGGGQDSRVTRRSLC